MQVEGKKVGKKVLQLLGSPCWGGVSVPLLSPGVDVLGTPDLNLITLAPDSLELLELGHLRFCLKDLGSPQITLVYLAIGALPAGT